MKFVLTPYSLTISETELIADLKRVASLVGDEYMSISKYKRLGGKHSDCTFIKYFGSWIGALEKAGLRTSRNDQEMKRISDEQLINDVRRVARLNNTNTITSSQYAQEGIVSLFTMNLRFGSWDNILRKAGLMPTGCVRNISDIELLQEIERIWIMLGRQPTTNDIKVGVSKYNLSTFTRRFGGWRGALETFIKYVNGEVVYADEDWKVSKSTDKKSTPISQVSKNSIKTHRTKREPSNRLKVQVLMRDGNRCRLCGVECNDGLHNIHFDHIIPWSKGGETTLENLQVLCSDCNLAKGNLD